MRYAALAVRPAVLSLFLPAASCAPGEGERGPSSGTSAASPPAAPRAAPAADSLALPPGVSSDSASRLRALLDSAAALDSAFQRERTALNAEAAAMASLDRRSDAYAARYDALRARQLAAEQGREVRDRTRRRAQAMRERLLRRAARTEVAPR